MKKFLTTLLTVVLTATLAIGGTMAYLTQDAGDENNVFSVGDIDVSLNEKVGVFGEGGTVDKTEDGAKYTEIMPGDYLKKKVTVTNNGKTDAYVAVTVTVNNGNKIAAAIDDYYEKKLGKGDETEAHIYNMYNNIFDGWGMNYYHDNEYGDDARNTITLDDKHNTDWPEHALKVDYAETMTNYWLFSKGNWFKSEAETKHDYWTESHEVNGNFSLGYYTKNLEKGKETYTMIYTYYLYLPAGESSTLFNGLNVPAEFDADQLAMFNGLEINVEAKAIQADNMGIAEKYADDETYGKAKTAFAVLAGDISADSLDVNNKPNTVKVNGNTLDTLTSAIENASEGDTVVLTQDIDFGTNTYKIDKNIILDLGGNTVTSSARNGVFYAKGGCSIINGNIQHNGTVAGIKVWQAEAIEDVTLILNGKSSGGNNITGISVQEGSDTYIGSLSNVKIIGNGKDQNYNGIETYNCGGRTDYAIGTMENVKVDVNGTALVLSAPAGTATNCEFKGGVYGINAHLKGNYNVSLNLVECSVSGGTYGIYAWDEPDYTNPGSLTLVGENTNVTGGVIADASDDFGERWSITGFN